MKRFFKFMSVAVCAVALFTACGDDDDAPKGVDNFAGTYEGQKMVLKMGESTMPSDGKSVVVSAVSEGKATVTLNNIVPDGKAIAVEVATVNADGSVAFEGKATEGACEVSVKGNVKDGVASVLVSRKVTAPVPPVLTLKYTEVAGNPSAAIYVKMVSNNSTVDMMMGMMLPAMLGQKMAMKVEEVKVAFPENGLLGISWKKVGQPQAQDMSGLAKMIRIQYCVVDNKMMVAVDKSYVSLGLTMFKDLFAKHGVKPEDIVKLLVDLGGYYALPLNTEVNGNDVTVFVDKSLLLPVLTIAAPIITPMVPVEFADTFNAVMAALPTATTANLGLTFVK